jgi:hypothetical protein
MGTIDWVVLWAYFLLMVGIGVQARSRIKTAADFFAAGRRMPRWLSGISHHMSGYSAAVFVGYAAIAYTRLHALCLVGDRHHLCDAGRVGAVCAALVAAAATAGDHLAARIPVDPL